MRLFVAIPIPQREKQYLLDRRIKLEDSRIRWVPPENLHITLLFLGEQPPEKLKTICEHLSTIAVRQEVFSLSFHEIVLRYRQRFPSMLWARLHPNHSFEQLYHSLHQCFGQKPHPSVQIHVTLARIRQMRRAPDVLKKRPSLKGTFQVQQIELWQSHLHEEGSRYERVHTFDLAAG